MRLALADPGSIVADKAARKAEEKTLPQSFWDLVAHFAQARLSQSATPVANKRAGVESIAAGLMVYARRAR